MSIKSIILLLLILALPLLAKDNERKKIAVCIPALHAPDSSVQSLIESGRRHFCRHHDVQYFIIDEALPSMEGEDIEWLPAGSGSFKLFSVLQGHKKTFEAYNYLFVIDPKMVFVASVGDEVFGELIAVQKINSTSQKPIFSSSFYGGRPHAIFDLLKLSCKYGTSLNESEEMMLNRCFKEKSPTRILNPSYAYPENWELQYAKKIVESRG